jgi:hypothetical protein
MRRNFLVATFADSHRLLAAVRAVREANVRIHDVYAPYPVHDLDHAMGLRRSRLPLVTLVAGASALAFAVFFQFYTTVLDWPLNVGGKPDNSSLAFVPISFELTVLIGGLSTFAALLLRTRLFPGKRERLPVPGVTNDTLALVVRPADNRFELARARSLLQFWGANEIEEIEEDL